MAEYSAVKVRPPRWIRGDMLDWEEFKAELLTCVMAMEPTAGAGVPYAGIDNRVTHRHWIEDPLMMPLITYLLWVRTIKLSRVSAEEWETLTPEECVRRGLCDPVRVFVKGEPHKSSKLVDKRFRIIMSVSLLDQLVARMLFRMGNHAELLLHEAIPSQPGMGLSSDEQVERFQQRLSLKCGIPLEDLHSQWATAVRPTDCSGFDWSVQDWMLVDDLEVRNRLTIGCPPILKRMRSGWLHCLMNSVLELGDGTLLAQTEPGIQKSGSYLTSSTNSRVRFMCAVYAGAEWAFTMGDDALEDANSSLEIYERLGLKVEASDRLEFCSQHFVAPTVAIPAGVGKMLYKLLNSYDPGSSDPTCALRYASACEGVVKELRHLPADQIQALAMFLAKSDEEQSCKRE